MRLYYVEGRQVSYGEVVGQAGLDNGRRTVTYSGEENLSFVGFRNLFKHTPVGAFLTFGKEENGAVFVLENLLDVFLSKLKVVGC